MATHEKHEQGLQQAKVDRRQGREGEAVPGEGEEPVEHAASRQQPPAGVQSVEPQDSSLTGASGALQRELLGLNAETNRKDGRKAEAQPDEDTPAGQHATGSNVDPSKGK